MDSVAVTVPLRPPTKKMKKRKELDALAAPHAITRRNSGKRSSQVMQQISKELLTDSSDDRSEYWSVSTRGGRKCRGGRRSRSCPGFLRACSAFLACASILATATLIWLFIDVRQQLSALRTELDQVIAGNENVPDTLQKYHSLSRDLQNNQTIIFANLNDIKLQIANFTTQLSTLQHGLHDVQNTIKAAPELSSVPEELKSLKDNQATIGSQVNDLKNTVVSLKSSNTRIQDVQNNLLANITTLENSLATLSNNVQRPEAVLSDESKAQIESMRTEITQLVRNLTLLAENSTQYLKWTTENRKADLKQLGAVQEQVANVSTKIASLENECARITNVATMKDSVAKLSESLKAGNLELEEKLKQLDNRYNTLQNSSDAMLASIIKLQKLTASVTAQDANLTGKVLSRKDVGESSATKLLGQVSDEGGTNGKSPSQSALDSVPVKPIRKSNTGGDGTT
ncbi:myosin type-2 heavy chain 1 isoform X1 [Neodiprion fabricii]|uniref:myosin type-2 heavy chain 1 isoform X1 n=1 Tax=Neodiprion fabricii TaxID=2872261 RepID=UPI001ED928D6|nr:myosin type-2 heavy chain 1 isoform X1 [Neodiprion fabricii]XP_046436457.1 myosin type-2 heavy chain 1 isoform X1 [Neodiprion fabricii]XP_046436458.1 myosin type-2 heavy chain 1 isoform X1 [Neodiprion fabricii]XP_046436459.1 myosin type-2 heavy chain 1 isoform X1 [Neodiprion fabricii]XP_046436462.1 myosin type-2 heavy chain 1 isoform X1 [Neodiprion fabricii]XP_046436463.1 myosin type-2 heavy chain 1 isoform X1 [Neodiprion fabricii]XP_046436464.1 myosin type-2 heavy chain 1 isoform X1 [Neod